VVVDLSAAAVRGGDGDDIAFGIVEIAGFASEGVAFYGNAAIVVAFAVAALSVGVDAALEHFAVGVVTVVFVAGHQSVGLVVFDHDVVAIGETAQFFAVTSVNGGQIAVAGIDFGKQQPCTAVGRGNLAEVV